MKGTCIFMLHMYNNADTDWYVKEPKFELPPELCDAISELISPTIDNWLIH